MVFCSKCGEKLNERTKFCSNCGTKANSETSKNIQSTSAHTPNSNVQKKFQKILFILVVAIIFLLIVGYMSFLNSSRASKEEQTISELIKNTPLSNSDFKVSDLSRCLGEDLKGNGLCGTININFPEKIKPYIGYVSPKYVTCTSNLDGKVSDLSVEAYASVGDDRNEISLFNGAIESATRISNQAFNDRGYVTVCCRGYWSYDEKQVCNTYAY
jgi:hypothetical protein